MIIEPTREEILEEMERATYGTHKKTQFRGMSYEDGVVAAMEWIIGQTTSKPMDDYAENSKD